MPYHEVSPGRAINYTIHRPSGTASNKKPWVVLINGLADPQTTWADQVPTFTAAGYTVLTYDNRGVGLSWRPETEELWTAQDMADDLRSLVVGLDVPKPYHVLGVSMGGMISQQYAFIAGQEILSLIPACTYAAPGPFCSRMFKLWRDMAVKMSVADAMRDVLLWCFTPEWFADPARQPELEAAERDMARIDVDMGLPAYLSQLNVIVEFDSRQTAPALADLNAVTVLAGESDNLIPNVLSKELHTLIPGSRWVTVRGGHACNWEYPAEFNQICLQIWSEAEKKWTG